jgi:hypothetical protein
MASDKKVQFFGEVIQYENAISDIINLLCLQHIVFLKKLGHFAGK